MRRFVVLAACFGLLAVGPIADSRAAGIPLPENATIVLPGHGWGHGRGMGQWGARGMADAGATWTTIVNHYYSGITIGSRVPETIRVLLETSADTIVTADAPFKIAWSTGSAIATSDATYKFWRVSSSGSTYTVQKSTAWNGPWLAVQSSAQSVVFTPQTQMLQLVYGNGVVRYYRGTISSKYATGYGVRSINELPLEQYLYGSVPRESPASWPAEELKAQAVAARSYAIYKKLNARAAGQMYDICTTTACQSYLGYASKSSVTGTKTVLESASSNAAVNATAGKVLLYGGKPICAEYSSSTGGFTASGTVGYEKAVSDPTDSVGPLHNWTGKVSVPAIESAWPSIGRLIDLTVTQRNGYGDWGGRVLQMTLVGTTGTVSVSGSSLQGAFPSSVRSNWFTPLYWRGQVVSLPSSVTAIQGSPLTVSVLIKNTGTAAWPVGGSVRTYTPGASVFYMPSWIATTRVASVARNVTAPSSSSVAPGQTAEFRLPLSTNLEPGDHAQSFGLVADGSSFMALRFPITVRILKPWVDETPNMLTNASFDSVAGWSGSGRTTGDGVTTAFAREGTHSYALTAGTKDIYQTKTFAGGRSRAFTLGGWSRSDATSISGGQISIVAVARYVDGTTQTWSLPFALGPHAWTYAESTFVTSATKDLASVTVLGQIASQTGTSYFDALRLVENPVTNFSFERGLSGWTAAGLGSGDGATLTDKRDGAQSLSIAGGSSTKTVSQSFHFGAAAGEKLLLSAWSETAGTSPSGGPLSVVVGLHHPNGLTTESTLPISAAPHAWARAQIEIVATAPVDSAWVKVVAAGQTGTLNVDDVELVRDWGVNPSFEGSLSSWSTYSFTTGDGFVSSPVRDGSGALAITAGGRKGALESIAKTGAAGARFIVSGWSKTTGTSANGGPVSILVKFLNTDGTTTYRSLVFATAPHDWTYQEAVVSAAKQFSKVFVYAISYDQTGSTWFDTVRFRSV